jgi:CRISPR-associated protein Csb1
MNALTLQELNEAVAGSAAAFRCRRRLEPAGGPGDKVFQSRYVSSTCGSRSGRETPSRGRRRLI